MKKIILSMMIFLCPIVANADGYVPETTPTPSPQQEVEPFSNEIEKQEVKAPNQKQSNTLPIVLTIGTIGILGGGYYFYQTKKRIH